MTRARNNLYLFNSGEPSRYLKEIEKALLDDISPNAKSNIEDTDDLPF